MKMALREKERTNQRIWSTLLFFMLTFRCLFSCLMLSLYSTSDKKKSQKKDFEHFLKNRCCYCFVLKKKSFSKFVDSTSRNKKNVKLSLNRKVLVWFSCWIKILNEVKATEFLTVQSLSEFYCSNDKNLHILSRFVANPNLLERFAILRFGRDKTFHV